jgi:hypothetical protein
MWFIVIGAAVVLFALIGRNKIAGSSVTPVPLDNGATGSGQTAASTESDAMATRAPVPVYAPVTRGKPPASTSAAPPYTAPVPRPAAPPLGSVAVSNAALVRYLGR